MADTTPDEVLYRAYLEGSLLLNKNGEWVHEGTRISNKNITDFFHRSIQWSPAENKYILRIGKGEATFDLEDSAFFVVSFNQNETTWKLTLLSGTTEDFSPETLELNSEGVMYCRVSGKHRAKILRNAFQSLAEHFIDESSIRVGEKTYTVRTTE